MTEQDTQFQILTAAETRFQLYGYNKTTMAEIAADCAMSAANLYRFFKNKHAIAAALAQQCLLEKETLLEQIVNDKTLSGSEKLSAFILQLFNHTYDQFESAPKMTELVEAITTQRPDVIAQHRESKLLLLKLLLTEAKQSGEFVFDDADETADAIHTATLLFYFPLCMTLYSREQLEDKAINITRLLIDGLRVKAANQ